MIQTFRSAAIAPRAERQQLIIVWPVDVEPGLSQVLRAFDRHHLVGITL